MDKIILEFPKQFKIGIERAKNIEIKNKFKGLIICGMGGSALPGDILKAWLRQHEINLPLYIHRNYGLPYFANTDQLIICVSYSGNTEETLSSFQSALRENLPLAVITSGGKLAEIARKNNIPLAIVPAGIVPRLAIGYQFGALLEILSNASIFSDHLNELISLEQVLQVEELKEQGQELAKKIINKIPIIYSSEKNQVLGKIWKIAFNETAKMIAISNNFPELSHNEIVGFEKKNKPQIENKKLIAIFLEDGYDYPDILKQMQIVKDILEKDGVKLEAINLTGKGILEKIFSNIILAFWTAYYLALENKVDPLKTKNIEEIKKRLSGGK